MNILITGGGSGIGRASAARLASRGAVIVADRDGAAAEAVAADIRSRDGNAIGVEVDVSSRDSVDAMMQRIKSSIGPVDALFNNAGVSIRQRISDITELAWDTLIAVHVKGVLLVSQAVLPDMLAAGRGVIVNSASDFSVAGAPGAPAYAAAKSAVYSLTKAMAVEFTSAGIRVNAVGPGPIDTPMLRCGRSPAAAEAAMKANQQRTAMKRLGRPEEVARVVDFLISPRSSYIAGQIIHPNGGTLTW